MYILLYIYQKTQGHNVDSHGRKTFLFVFFLCACVYLSVIRKAHTQNIHSSIAKLYTQLYINDIWYISDGFARWCCNHPPLHAASSRAPSRPKTDTNTHKNKVFKRIICINRMCFDCPKCSHPDPGEKCIHTIWINWSTLCVCVCTINWSWL